MRAGRPLDALNFFLADVRDGLGPYLAIYLLIERQWDEASIGAVMAVAGLAGIVAQTPAGALIDRTTAKRGLVAVAAIAVAIASVALPAASSFTAVAVLQAISGIAAAIFSPAIAAITLGIVGPRAFARRIGRNEAFNHAGNATAAIIAGISAYWLGPIAVFWLMAATAVASIVATAAVPRDAIDHDAARGGEAGHDGPSGFASVLANRPLLIFAACATLFHFANAAMLPLVGQKLALATPDLATTLLSVCIVGAQAVMVPVALLVGARADAWGRKPIFAAGLAALALRGALYPLSDDPFWLVGVQLLDGVGAGIFGALFPLIVADLTRGSGRFNVSQGAIATAQGIGAALSTAVAGVIVVQFGYGAAFLALAGIAAATLALFWWAMPETTPRDQPADVSGTGTSNPLSVTETMQYRPTR